MRIIKLMADYQCFPLWEQTPSEGVGPINPSDLPITESLCQDLIAWAADYDATLDLSDPLSSGFKSPEDEANFRKTGELLGARLKEELGNQYKVIVRIIV